MKNRLRTIVTITALSLGIFLFTSCKKDHKHEVTPQDQIRLKTNTTLGSILTDESGRTLYYFSNDAAGQNTCLGGCAAVWPIFNVDNLTEDVIDAGLSIADFGAITTADGKKQTTYKGWPLYYFAPSASTPEAAGQVTGEGVDGVWFVAKPDYSIMLANAQLVGKDGKNYLSTYVEGTGKTIYFTNANGVTLYTFKNDKVNKNNYTSADFSNNATWPIYETDKIVVPSVLDKTLFASITVSGKKQLTYKGWPLYNSVQDANVRGTNKGVSIPTPGVWPVAVKNIVAAPNP